MFAHTFTCLSRQVRRELGCKGTNIIWKKILFFKLFLYLWKFYRPTRSSSARLACPRTFLLRKDFPNHLILLVVRDLSQPPNPPCRKNSTDQPTFLARKASNHSSNFSPIVGKTLNLKSSETKLFRLFWYRGTRDNYLSAGAQRKGTRLEVFIGWRSRRQRRPSF